MFLKSLKCFPFILNCSLSKFTSFKGFLKNTSHHYYSTFIQNDTIFALSSGFGKCGVAVIRVSGSKTKNVILKLTGRKALPPPRKTFVSKLHHPLTKVLLDRALVVWFASPHSFTGEDVCEFQVHGGPAVISAVLNALGCFDGLRPAEAGDYTKRAFLNNKMDLTEVEGLGDLIHAETEAQRRQALHQMEGSLSRLYSDWSSKVLKCTAHMEAFLDFSEDEALDEKLIKNLNTKLNSIKHEISEHLADKQRGEILRNGVRVAILGYPNVGKSSLLNAIIQRPAAIVSPIAGTTRDVIETNLNVDGFPVLISDTAGVCESKDIIEKEGIKRAFLKAKQADLVIIMISAETLRKPLNVKAEINKLCSNLGFDFEEKYENTIIVVNKIDLDCSSNFHLNKEVCPVSCKTMAGFSDFMLFFINKIKHLCGEASLGEIPSVTQQRHRSHLQKCIKNLSYSIKYIEKDVVISAEYLRMALNEISKISGKIGAEEILDVIFKDFCIGK